MIDSELAQELSKILQPYFAQVEAISKDLRAITEALTVLKTEAHHRAENLSEVVVSTASLAARLSAVEVRLAVVEQQVKADESANGRTRTNINTVVISVITLLIGAVLAGLKWGG